MEEPKKYKHSLVFKKPDLENIAFSFWSPTLQDWREVIEDYIEISRKRRLNKLSMFKLQADIISDLISVNRSIKNYKILLDEPERRNVEFPYIEINNENIEHWERELKVQKIILNALKDVGDGIAWRVLNYNRSLLYNMCVNNDDSGPLTINDGLISEIYSLNEFVYDVDVVNFVFHGITNFLLIGDITVLYKNGEINFIEVKNKKNQRGTSWKERIERQKTRAENLISFANEGTGYSTDVEVKSRLIPSAPQISLQKLRTSFITINKTDFVSLGVSSYLTMVLTNISMISTNKNWELFIDRIFKNLRKSPTDLLLPFNSIDNFVFSPNRAPLSIHPFTSEAISNILLGRYIVWYLFNASTFFSLIEKQGWKVSNIIYYRKEDSEDKSVFTVSKENLRIKIPPTIFSRVVYEGLSISSLVQIFENTLQKGPIDTNYGLFYGFEKEYLIWN